MRLVKRAVQGVSAVFLLLAGAPLASAQSYQFTSCSSGVVFKATITSIISNTGARDSGTERARSSLFSMVPTA